MTRMPFGKYKGLPLSAVPDDYLAWLIDECDLREPLKSAVEAEVEARMAADEADDEPQPGLMTVQSIAGDWYRRLATEFHPDKRGGSNEAMKAINRGRELLLELAGGQG